MTASERIRAAREQRDALRLEGTISTFPGPEVLPCAGQLTLDYDEVRKPTILEQPYVCCEGAVVVPRDCVCFFVSTCPVHGVRHNGTHD